MSTQFLFPSGDVLVGDFLDQTSGLPLYDKINNGVTTSDDAEFIQLPASSDPSFTVDLGPMFIHFPTGIYFNIRHSGIVDQDIEFNLKDKNGVLINSTESRSLTATASVFSNFTVTDPVSEANRSAFDFRNTQLEVTVRNNGSGIPQISEVEAVVLGSGTRSFKISGFNMFCPGTDFAKKDNSNITLFGFGATPGSTGLYNQFTLFTDGQQQTRSGNMILFIDAFQNPVADNKTMNLFLKALGDESGFQTTTKTTTLFLENTVVADSGNVTLVMWNQGTGESGSIPFSGNMNLFINRQFESTAHRFPLYTAGPSGFNNTLTLFMQGNPNARSGISMFIDAVGKETKAVTLYGHGF